MTGGASRGAPFAFALHYNRPVSLIDDRSTARKALRVLLLPGILAIAVIAVLVIQALT